MGLKCLGTEARELYQHLIVLVDRFPLLTRESCAGWFPPLGWPRSNGRSRQSDRYRVILLSPWPPDSSRNWIDIYPAIWHHTLPSTAVNFFMLSLHRCKPAQALHGRLFRAAFIVVIAALAFTTIIFGDQGSSSDCEAKRIKARTQAPPKLSSLTLEETMRRFFDPRLDPTERRIYSRRVA